MALGALQGPAELLPVSSSAHLTVVPALARWRSARLDPERRKALEVALHGGAALALLALRRRELREELRALGRRRLGELALATVPAAFAGLALERPVERRLSAPPAIACAQLAAATSLVLADARPSARVQRDVGAGDHLAVGIGQATALVPGVSRSGATLTAARLRGLDRAAAGRLSRRAALPVMAAAAALKGLRLARRGLPSDLVAGFAAASAAAFASTVLSHPLLVWVERTRSWTPIAAYRWAFAGAVLAARRAAPAGCD